MKQVIINIPENKFPFFMKLMRSLNFVKVVEANPAHAEKLSAEQQKTWENVKQGFEELKMSEKGEIKFRPVQELLNEL
ncbi:MAG: hypothetical protein NVSMB24_19260 [Mucilaginibacter sp.]